MLAPDSGSQPHSDRPRFLARHELKGWWATTRPIMCPLYLTQHARPPIQMDGGTTFYFVTGGIHEALDRAREAANGMDVRIGGGPNTIRQYLRTGLIDELHVAISPVLLAGRVNCSRDTCAPRDTNAFSSRWPRKPCCTLRQGLKDTWNNHFYVDGAAAPPRIGTVTTRTADGTARRLRA